MEWKADHRSEYLSIESASRAGNSLKQAAKYLSKPGLISLGGGLPSSEYFPFDSLSITTPTPPHFGEADVSVTGATLTAGKHDLAEDKGIFDIATAFNYGQGTGAAQLLRWVTEHTELVHNPPYADWSCTLSIGSTSALDMTLRMLSQPGDHIISEEYTFATAVETAEPMGVKVVGVSMDAEGLLPAALDEVLSNWDRQEHAGARKPFLLYTVPTGQNPTGATQSLERRREIYAVSQKHDLIIIEDEPYYFLQMQPYTGPGAPDAPLPKSHEEFLESVVPSYLSMDVDGRVLRMDSFSKIVTPGSRVGWITAPDQLVERYRRHADVSTQGPSGISQLVLFKLLDEHWGHEGFLDWLIHIRVEYTRRRDAILEACETYLPKDLVTWVPPMAGMFVSHPLSSFLHLPRFPLTLLPCSSGFESRPQPTSLPLFPSRSSRRASSWRALMRARLLCAAAGSMPMHPWLVRRSFSVSPTHLRRPIRSTRPSGDLAMPCGRALAWRKTGRSRTV
jgi:aromatic amino acid aminotransferase I / 2-aminoadipate transaminase